MDITILIDRLPSTVKCDIIDYTPVRLKDGRHALRVLLDRIATPAEKTALTAAGAIGVDCIARHRYAPEIQHSYFYMVTP